MVDDLAGISVVVPMRDAAGRLPALHARLMEVLQAHHPRHEVIYVDDRSTDHTWSMVVDLARGDPSIVGVRLAEGSGQVAAVQAGLRRARLDLVAIMDDDLEIDPTHLDELVEALVDGIDLVSARRVGPRPVLRRVGSAVVNARLRSWGYPFEDVGCAFMVMRRTVAADLAAQGQRIRDHRFKPAVVQRGYRTTEVPVPSQRTGGSHFGVAALAGSWFGVEAATRPTVLLGLAWVGMAAMAAAVVVLLAAVLRGEALEALAAVAIGLLGLGLVGLGFAGNLVIRTLVELERDEPEVAETTHPSR